VLNRETGMKEIENAATIRGVTRSALSWLEVELDVDGSIMTININDLDDFIESLSEDELYALYYRIKLHIKTTKGT
jgi:tRNA threonylcarbamoyladenosine modification (KEOPS) complex Cgi121 subunit